MPRCAAAVELGEFTERALGDGTAPRKFPYAGESEALNSVSLHPRLLAACAQLLGEGEHGIRLAQATLLDPARGGPSDGAAETRPATCAHRWLSTRRRLSSA